MEKLNSAIKELFRNFLNLNQIAFIIQEGDILVFLNKESHFGIENKSDIFSWGIHSTDLEKDVRFQLFQKWIETNNLNCDNF